MVSGLINQVRGAPPGLSANYDVMRGSVIFLVAECGTDAAESNDTNRRIVFVRPSISIFLV